MSALLNTQPSQMLEMNNNTLAPVVSPAAATATVLPGSKDSRWLTLEVCREFLRSKCSRTDQECKFAHPPPHVEVQNGRVTCCFDSIKGKCQRKDPPCKYLHPPQHLKEQLVQNGRNNLILKQLQTQALFNGVVPAAGLYPNTQAVMYDTNTAKPLPYAAAPIVPGHPYTGGMMAPQFIIPSSMQLQGSYPGLLQVPYGGGLLQQAGSDNSLAGVGGQSQLGSAAGGLLTTSQGGLIPGGGPQPKGPARPESHGNGDSSYNHASTVNDTAPTSTPPQTAAAYPTIYSLPQQQTMPQMMIKRPAILDNKTGLPMYPLGTQAVYQQSLMAANPGSLHVNPHFIPVSPKTYCYPGENACAMVRLSHCSSASQAMSPYTERDCYLGARVSAENMAVYGSPTMSYMPKQMPMAALKPMSLPLAPKSVNVEWPVNPPSFSITRVLSKTDQISYVDDSYRLGHIPCSTTEDCHTYRSADQ